ncbi:short-chain dehydrogenase [Christiangramia fulva]|uniref:Short-chain dehydrogenase n=1 Tax=Christiangramia fulva TaxID=2126553 RepID=A0A2R3Z151_9FLAO|nr:SDR family oxidoreductase [Christiangramia fulva]AVR43997.1 short-chain dehydrogenase [Christiangramia fulva]
MHYKNKKILITGAGSGIGKSILKQFVDRGATSFAVVGRKKEPLEELKKEFPGANFTIITGDVSKKVDLDKIVRLVEESMGGLDILVNNAGVVSAGLLQDISDEDIINQININLTGLILLTKKSLALLKKSKEGAIINISSGLGYIGMPFYSVYAATKAAVRQFSDSLRRELLDYPLHIMTVYPTTTDTNMMKNAKVGEMDTPEEVAEATLKGMEENEINVILGGEQRKKQIELNFNDPKKMDELSKQNYESMRERTENHRSM